MHVLQTVIVCMFVCAWILCMYAHYECVCSKTVFYIGWSMLYVGLCVSVCLCTCMPVVNLYTCLCMNTCVSLHLSVHKTNSESYWMEDGGP